MIPAVIFMITAGISFWIILIFAVRLIQGGCFHLEY